SKASAIKAQVDEVVGIMQKNIELTMQREERLEVLQDRTENLSSSARDFNEGTRRVRRQMWWKDMKMKIIIGVVIVILLIVIIVPIVTSNKK
ncbi:synaptobrevin, partial [Ramicandelaber brevisporus]